MLTTTSPDSSLHLLLLLLQCAELISTNHHSFATDLLPQLFELSSPFGTPFDRVAAFFTHSLHSRLLLHAISPPPPQHHTMLKAITLVSKLDHLHSALQSYNSLTPFVKFSHFTSNQAIYDAVSGYDRVHIIDLDIMQGLQWPGLFHILASRVKHVNNVKVKVTGFGPSSKLLAQTGTRLAEFAEALGLPFEFRPIEGKIGNLSELEAGQLGVRQPNEVIVVHCMHHRLYDIVGCGVTTMKVLSVIRPRLVTVVEQDLDVTHTTSFSERFVEALHYYCALFDAIGEGLGRDSVQRHQVEQQLFGSEIRNILAVGGRINGGDFDGVTRWGHELVRAGFQPFSLSGSPAAQAGLLLEMFPCKGYTLVEQNGCLRLGWKDLPLLTASAWQPSSNFGGHY